MLVEDGIHGGGTGAVPAEGRLEGARGGQLGAAVAGDGHGDLLPGPQLGGGPAHHLHGVGVAVAGGPEPHLPAPALHRSHQGAVGPLRHGGDLGDLPLRVPGVVAHLGGDLVPRPGPAVPVGRHEEVGLPARRPLRSEKAEHTGGGLIGSLYIHEKRFSFVVLMTVTPPERVRSSLVYHQFAHLQRKKGRAPVRSASLLVQFRP